MKILCSAIWYKDFKVDRVCRSSILPRNLSQGVVLSGHRHHNCISQFWALTGRATAKEKHVQGFLTDANTFVDRVEGMKIARNADQLTVATKRSKLFSEDLY